ncbi:MAG: hypothetical protein AAF547_22615, partial [Actinomycetota bacterium]
MTDIRTQLPQTALALVEAEDWTGPPLTGPAVTGIACFVDLARFTTISEALGRSGSTGTEELVVLLNRFFTPVIDRALAIDGDVVGFAGDALTVVFPPGRLTDVHGWASGTLRTVAGMPAVEADGRTFPLAAKIGIAAGDHRTHIVGTARESRSVTGGTAIDAAVAAEGAVLP